MHIHHFEEKGDIRHYDMEEPNFFGISIGYDPYKKEMITDEKGKIGFKGGDGGGNICGGLGIVLGFLPCSPYYKSQEYETIDENNYVNGNYEFIRRIIRIYN